jgi:hypothetical protein
MALERGAMSAPKLGDLISSFHHFYGVIAAVYGFNFTMLAQWIANK